MAGIFIELVVSGLACGKVRSGCGNTREHDVRDCGVGSEVRGKGPGRCGTKAVLHRGVQRSNCGLIIDMRQKRAVSRALRFGKGRAVRGAQGCYGRVLGRGGEIDVLGVGSRGCRLIDSGSLRPCRVS